jgi:hypothetical protein
LIQGDNDGYTMGYSAAALRRRRWRRNFLRTSVISSSRVGATVRGGGPTDGTSDIVSTGEVGSTEKKSLGALDGASLGANDGARLGACEGATLGARDGAPLGTSEGTLEGTAEGTWLGVVLGASD